MKNLILKFVEKNKIDLLVILYFIVATTAMYFLNEVWLK